MFKYYIRKIGRAEAWHVVAPNGLPIYDEERCGNDKPVVFRSLDAAMECINSLNESALQKEGVAK